MIYGVSDTLFEPDIPVTLEQCVTMLVHARGYGTEAENLGGFPQGYLEIGTGLGLLEQVSEQQGDISLTRGDMAIMVCNSLGLMLQVPEQQGDAPFTRGDIAILVCNSLGLGKT